MYIRPTPTYSNRVTNIMNFYLYIFQCGITASRLADHGMDNELDLCISEQNYAHRRDSRHIDKNIRIKSKVRTVE